MSQLTYSSIHPLISDLQEQNGQVFVTFTCPMTQKSFKGSARIQTANNIQSKVRQSVERNAMMHVRRAIFGLVGSIFGRGMVGRMARDVAYNAVPREVPQQLQMRFTKDDRERAVVAAFQSVASKFTWDAREGRWVSAESAQFAVDDFTKQITEAPIQQPFDQGVVARMIIEVARADGNLANEERDFLSEFIPPEVGDIQSIAAKPPLNEVELDEVTQGPVRETMLLLAWTIALTDEDLDSNEARRLQEFAQGLSISPHRARELKNVAQSFIFNKVLERATFTGYDANAIQQAMNVADQIGMHPQEAQRAEVRFRKLRGMF